MHPSQLLTASVLALASMTPLAASAQAATPIPGYTYGQKSLARAPYTPQDLHTSPKKNKTDKANSVPSVNFRYLSALTIPITTTLKPFLAKKGASAADVEKMHAAWVKSVLMQSILWSYPYVRDGRF